jgi:hypothetical protein
MSNRVKALLKKHEDEIIEITKKYVRAYAQHGYGLTLEDLLPFAERIAERAAETYDESIGGFMRYCEPHLRRLHRIACEILDLPTPYRQKRFRRAAGDVGSRFIWGRKWDAVCVQLAELLSEPDARDYQERVHQALGDTGEVAKIMPGTRITIARYRRGRHAKKKR